MKWLSEHNVNIVMKSSGIILANTVIYAVMEHRGKSYHFSDIFDGMEKGNVQRYLRSVIFNFKRIVYGLNS